MREVSLIARGCPVVGPKGQRRHETPEHAGARPTWQCPGMREVSLITRGCPVVEHVGREKTAGACHGLASQRQHFLAAYGHNAYNGTDPSGLRYAPFMPRLARIVIPGASHHVTQRGNNQQAVFRDDGDRVKYLELLRHYSEMHCLRIVAYCLMTNHIHLVAVPGFEQSLADTVGRTHQQYTEHFNFKYECRGHLWQNRYYSCPMDLDHTLNALAYVELNPVRAGMIGEAWAYPWSSAAAHTGHGGNRLLDLSKWFSEFTAESWAETLGGFQTKTQFVEQIRRHTRKGRPLGTDRAFLGQVAYWRASH